MWAGTWRRGETWPATTGRLCGLAIGRACERHVKKAARRGVQSARAAAGSREEEILHEAAAHPLLISCERFLFIFLFRFIFISPSVCVVIASGEMRRACLTRPFRRGYAVVRFLFI